MTELSGSLEGVGLLAIIRFLAGLKKTGCLHVGHDDWRGEVFFEAGQVTGASLGSWHGLPALEGLVQTLDDGSFSFDASARPARQKSIELAPEALQKHLNDLVARVAGGTPGIPALDSVPHLIPHDELGVGEEPLPLDRGTLQTLLAVDGRRTVREIVAQRATFDAQWQLGSLAELGLVLVRPPASDGGFHASDVPHGATPVPVSDGSRASYAARASAAARASDAASVSAAGRASDAGSVSDAGPVSDAVPVSSDGATVANPAEDEPQPATARCPKLGFDDDPGNAFARPTRLHRCFAADTPLPLSLDQQRELCMSDHFGTCPRLATVRRGAATPPFRAVRGAQSARNGSGNAAAPGAGSASGIAARASGVDGRSAPLSAEPEVDDSRIVRLPFAARNTASLRGPGAQRAAPSPTEPTRLHAQAFAQRNEGSPRPTPLRARMDRANRAALGQARVEPAIAPLAAPERAERAMVRPLLDDSSLLRIGGVPVRLILLAAAALVVLAVMGFLLAPHLGDLLQDDSADLSGLPNASAVAAGTPIDQIAPRPTRVPGTLNGGANATAVAASVPDGDTNAGTAVATAAPAVGSNPAAPATAPTVVAEATPAGPATAQQTASNPAPAAPTEGAVVLDEGFANNARAWPSDAQGAAWLNGGSYRLSPRQVGQFVAIGAPIADVLQDVVINATFHKLSGAPDGGGFGIIVRDQGFVPLDGTNQGGQYYALEVGDKGEVGIWRRNGDQWIDLVPWRHADAVHTGTASNELVVSAVGNKLSMSVNGTLVVTQTDNTLAAGHVGILAGGDGNQIAVDHFAVQAP